MSDSEIQQHNLHINSTQEFIHGDASTNATSIKINQTSHESITLQIDHQLNEDNFVEYDHSLGKTVVEDELIEAEYIEVEADVKGTEEELIEAVADAAESLEAVADAAESLEAEADAAESLEAVADAAESLEVEADAAEVLEAQPETAESLQSEAETEGIVSMMYENLEEDIFEEDELHDEDEDEDHEDHALAEILEMQRREEEEYQLHAELAANDAAVAAEAERLAADKERLEKEKERNARREARSRASAGGSGENSLKEDRAEDVGVQQPYTPGRRSSATLSGSRSSASQSTPAAHNTGSKMSANDLSSGMMKDLQQKLAEQMMASNAAANQNSADDDLNEEQNEQYRRFRIPRQYASPVERTIRIYNDYRTTLYDVLGVKTDIDDIQLKKIYRSVALNVHPDKNPHPDAKVAFDAIQDAYDGLASPSKRNEYDQRLRKMKRARRWTPRRIRKWIGEYIDNWTSSLMLMWVQHQRGELYGEVSTALRIWQGEKFKALIGLLQHFALLPTNSDRISLLHEHISRSKKLFLALGFLITLIL